MPDQQFFTPQAVDFLAENRIQNSREWFNEHRDQYAALVRQPLLQLSAALGDTMLAIDSQLVTLPTKTISRVNRDTRFTNDKSLYRDNMWVVFHRGKGMLWPTWFFEFSPRGYSWGVGYWKTPVPVRAKAAEWALKRDKRWLDAEAALQALPHCGLGGECYKRTRYPEADARQSDWVERKELDVFTSGKSPDVLFGTGLAETIAADFKAMVPCYNFMCAAHLEVEDSLPKGRER